jgi:molybdopterin/thiamine biosynthesis adenylyltransferase
MKRRRPRSADFEPVSLLLLGAGLIGRPLGALVATLPKVGRIRILDRDVYTSGQALAADCGRPKGQVVAEMIRALNPQVQVEYGAADIEDVPLGWFRCDVLLTALDSKRARMVANYAFRKLAIRYWIDAGVSAPWLVRVSTFAQGQNTPCYECALDSADYASEQSYPCQPAFTPPPTNSAPFLGSLAASLQAAECARLLAAWEAVKRVSTATVNRELVYDASSHRLFVTRLERYKTCRLDHGAFDIRPLPRSPRRMTLGEAFALGQKRTKSKSPVAAGLEVPGKLFVRELACQCGARRSGLCLKGRLGEALLTCKRCGRKMSPTGGGLSNVLARDALSPRELSKPLTALGLQPADIIAVGAGQRIGFYELGANQPGRDTFHRIPF